MLKYKIKNYDVEANWEPFKLDDIYLSPNIDFLSGTTDISSTIYQGSNVVLRKKGDDSFSRKMTAEVSTATRSGHVFYTEKLKEETVHSSYVNVNGDLINVERKYVTFRDTVYYKQEKNAVYGSFGSQVDLLGYFINGAFYTTSDDGYVYLTNTAYIEDGKVQIGSRVFKPFKVGDKVVLKHDEESITLSQINGKDYTVELYRSPVDIQKVVLRTRGNEPIDIEKVSCGSYTSYVKYKDQNYQIVLNSNNEYGAYIPNESGETVFVKANYDDPVPTQEEFALNVTLMPISGLDKPTSVVTECFVSSVLTESNHGYFLIINTVRENTYNEGDLIYVISDSYLNKQLEVVDSGDTKYVDLCGNRYYAVEHDYDVVEVNGNEYKLTYTTSDMKNASADIDGVHNDFTIVNGVAYYDEPMFFKVTKDGKNMTDYFTQLSGSTYIGSEYGDGVTWDSGYTVTSGYGVTIDSETYRVYTDSSGMTYIDVPTNEEYVLRIQQVIGSNMLICRPKTYNSLYPITSDEDASEICTSISLGVDNMSFYLMDDTLGERRVTPLNSLLDTIMVSGNSANVIASYQVKEPMSSLDVHGINDNLDFYREVAYHKIPVALTSCTNIGLNKEDEIKHLFVEDYTNANINRIVDMEKMMYRMVTKPGDDGIEVMNFMIHLSGDTADMVKNILYRKSNGEVPENVKSSFFRMSFYNTDDTQSQRLLGTMCLMLGPATIPNSKEPGGLIYSGNTSAMTEDTEVNLILSYDKAMSKEGFDLYYFKEYIDGDENLEAYMRLDFNNARTGQIIPLTWNNQEIPIKEMAESLYYKMQLIYNEKKSYKYGFCPVIGENDVTWVVDGDTLIVKCYMPTIKDESGLEDWLNENNS